MQEWNELARWTISPILDGEWDSHSIKDTGFNFVAARRPVPLTKGGIRDVYGQIGLG